MKILFYIVIALLVIWLYNKFMAKFKFPKVGSLAVVTGGVKCGKSSFGLGLALSNYRRVLRVWKIRKFFCKLFRRPIPEKPLLYSNIPLAVDYVEVDEDLINRRKRFRYGSVIFIDEANLLADSMSFADKSQNERIAIFSALIGQSTKGGLLVYTCHNIERLHYGIRDTASQYFYIHSLTKWIPFFVIANVRERVIGEDTLNVETKDVEMSLRKVILRKSVWKKFDSYAYSILTDDKPVKDDVIDGTKLPDLKVRRFLSFKNWNDNELAKFFKKFNEKEIEHEKKND